MDRILTCDEVAERYHVAKGTVWKWIRTRKLRAIRIGKSYLVTEGAVAEFERAAMTEAERS